MGQPLMNLMSVVARRFSSSSKERVVAAAGETKAKRLMNPRSVAARRFSSSSEEVKERVAAAAGETKAKARPLLYVSCVILFGLGLGYGLGALTMGDQVSETEKLWKERFNEDISDLRPTLSESLNRANASELI